MTLFLVWQGDYEPTLVGIFSTKQDADSCAVLFGGHTEEQAVDEYVEWLRRKWRPYSVRLTETQHLSCDAQNWPMVPSAMWTTFRDERTAQIMPCLDLLLWAADRKDAVRIASNIQEHINRKALWGKEEAIGELQILLDS